MNTASKLLLGKLILNVWPRRTQCPLPAPESSSLGLLTAGFLTLTFAGHRKLRKTTVAV